MALSDCSWTQPKLKSCGSAVCITTVQHRPRPSLEHCCQQQHNHASWQCLRPRYAVWQWNEHVFTVYWRRKDNLDVLSAPSTSVPIRWLLGLDVTATLVTFYHSSCMARNVGPSRRKMRGKSMLSISGACGGCLVSCCTSLFPMQKFCGRAFSHCSLQLSNPGIFRHMAQMNDNIDAKKIVFCSSSGRLEKTTRTSSWSHGSRLYRMTWNPTTSHRPRHLIWLKTSHSGGC